MGCSPPLTNSVGQTRQTDLDLDLDLILFQSSNSSISQKRKSTLITRDAGQIAAVICKFRFGRRGFVSQCIGLSGLEVIRSSIVKCNKLPISGSFRHTDEQVNRYITNNVKEKTE